MHVFAAIALLLLAVVPARADEQPVDLKPGAGQDIVQNECNVCHSLDYIRMNSPFLTADGWKAEVTKMRAAFGAPINDADADVIIKYLSTNYGLPAQ
jgi:mono/diheme cytochrome c family protein